MRVVGCLVLCIILLSLGSDPVQALNVAYAESFVVDDARWGTAGGALGLDYHTTGGFDGGGYVSDTHDFAFLADGDSIVAFRGHDELGSSGGAFVGNWITGGVARFQARVWHDGPAPMNFFTRFSSPVNFPGATAIQFTPVLPNTWTNLVFDILPSNPAFVTFEGSNFANVFSNIGHVQIGADVPNGFGGSAVPVTIALDDVAIQVPEPTGLVLMGVGIVLLRRSRR